MSLRASFGLWRDPAPEVRALSDLPGVTVTGLVPDIRQIVAQASVIVVPLRFVAGMAQQNSGSMGNAEIHHFHFPSARKGWPMWTAKISASRMI